MSSMMKDRSDILTALASKDLGSVHLQQCFHNTSVRLRSQQLGPSAAPAMNTYLGGKGGAHTCSAAPGCLRRQI